MIDVDDIILLDLDAHDQVCDPSMNCSGEMSCMHEASREDDDDFVVEFTQMDKAINHVEK